MKINVINDVHLEFGSWLPTNETNADVLVLAGDIVPIVELQNNSELYLPFFEACSKLYKNVIYVMGNHEYYREAMSTNYGSAYFIGGNMSSLLEEVRKILSPYENIHILENEYCLIDNIAFLGCTLWTNFNNKNPLCMMAVERSMNDYRAIKYNDSRLLTDDIIIEHENSVKFLTSTYSKLSKIHDIVVVTHHSPSFQSIPDQFRYDYELNSAYASNMEEFIYKRNKIKLWCYGHTHSPKQFTISKTIVVNNARGYAGSEVSLNSIYSPKLIEI